MINEIEINAIFTGKNLSCGFEHGLRYKLKVKRLSSGNFLALVDSEMPEMRHFCEYESIFSFLSNWNNINVVLS